jgi:hypothetical protein
MQAGLLLAGGVLIIRKEYKRQFNEGYYNIEKQRIEQNVDAQNAIEKIQTRRRR